MDRAIYKIIPELGLIIECCIGNVDIPITIEMKKKEIEDPEFSASYNKIVDFRRFTSFISNTNIETINSLIDFLEATNNKDNKIKVALLTDEPNQVVVSHILKTRSKNLSIYFEVFSTLNAASVFVGLNYNETKSIEETIQNL